MINTTSVINRMYGYARVSTDDQNLSLQIDALIRFGVQPNDIYSDKISGAKTDRPGLEKCMSSLRPGDTLVVWDLDRAFRSTLDALTQTKHLKERGVDFQIITMNIDTSDPMGEFFFTVVAAFAQLERRTISKRTKEGLKAARKRGKRLGRPPAMNIEQVQLAKQKIESNEATIREIAALNGVHPWTVTRSIKRLNI